MPHSTSSLISGRTFVLIGAGDAGRALAFGAKYKGARIIIFNRDYSKDYITSLLFMQILFLFLWSFDILLMTILVQREQKPSLMRFLGKHCCMKL